MTIKTKLAVLGSLLLLGSWTSEKMLYAKWERRYQVLDHLTDAQKRYEDHAWVVEAIGAIAPDSARSRLREMSRATLNQWFEEVALALGEEERGRIRAAFADTMRKYNPAIDLSQPWAMQAAIAGQYGHLAGPGPRGIYEDLVLVSRYKQMRGIERLRTTAAWLYFGFYIIGTLLVIYAATLQDGGQAPRHHV